MAEHHGTGGHALQGPARGPGAAQALAVGHPQGAGHHAHSEVGVTGIDNRKLGMWLFLASECMFFGAFIVAYIAYQGKSLSGPTPEELLNIPLTSLSTFVLLMSSLAMVLAVQAAQQDRQADARKWLLATALLGLGFLSFQAYEYTHFIHAGLTLSVNLFGTTFYTLTGLHGLHVTIGVGWLLALFLRSLKVGLGRAQALSLELAGLYWHFVDVVWIVIFTLVYLMSVLG
ncbi:MAG: cytochrome c oxidase subunit 3 [Bacillota bacterium]